MQIIKTVLFSLANARQLRLRAARPFCRSMPQHFRHFPRFAGELPARGSLYAVLTHLDVSTALRSAQHDDKSIAMNKNTFK